MTANIDPTDVLDVLADEYARAILETVQQTPLTAPEVASQCGCSKATVYRRLDDLVATGLVAQETEIDPHGHHRTRYRLRPVRLAVSVCQDGLDGEISHRSDRAGGGHGFERDGPTISPGSPAD